MTLKNVLLSSACCAGMLLSPLASASAREAKTEIIVGTAKAPAAMAVDADKRELKIFQKDAAELKKDDAQRATGPSNATQRMVSTDAKQVDFIQQSSKAHADKTGHGKPAEAPSSTSSPSGSKGGSANPVAARLDTNARAMEVVGEASKAKAQKNASGRPGMDAKGPSASGSGSKGGSQNPIAARMDTGARAMSVVGQAKTAKAQKNASGKPGEPSGNSNPGMSAHSSGSAGGHGGGRFASQFRDRVGAMAPSMRGSPGERASSHCNARGMCF